MNLRKLICDSLSFTFLGGIFLLFAIGADEDLFMAHSGRFWLASVALFVLSGGFSLILYRMNFRTLGEVLFAPHGVSSEGTSWYRAFWGWQLLGTLAVAFALAFAKTEFSFYELADQNGFAGAVRLFQGLLNPNWTLLPRAVLNIIETIFMAFLATTLAIPLAFVLSFLCARNIMKGTFLFSTYLVLRTFLNLVRSVEALIWAIIFSVWVGIGPFAGMLALMIHSVASLAKQYSEMVEAVEEGPIEAIESTGANRLQTIWYAIVPQVLLPYISFTVYRWDINVRMATVIGLVGGGGIGTMLVQYQGQAMWSEVGCIIFVIAVVVWALDQASAYVREALK